MARTITRSTEILAMCIVPPPVEIAQPAFSDCPAQLPLSWETAQPTSSDHPAHLLTAQQRRQLALHALAGQSVSYLAQQHHVSRKFVYQQLDIAIDAIDQAFAPDPPPCKDRVLFYLPVTKAWLRQFVLALVLIGHCSFRGVCEVLADLFDCHLSLGSVHNIVQGAVASARQINACHDLSAVGIGIHDEIFQAGAPVLVGVDARSTFCYLLSLEEQRDGDTWGVRLLELIERGFAPDATIADAAKGIACGVEQALPGVPRRGDVFHALYAMGPLVTYLENRAYQAMATVEKLTSQQKQHERRQGRKKQSVAQKLRHAKAAQKQAIALAEDVATLYRWLQQDILAVAGADYQTRLEMLNFVVAELLAREQQCEHRIRPVRIMLENQGKDLLAFAAELDKQLKDVAQQWQVSEAIVRELLRLQQMGERDCRRWQGEARLREKLRGRYYGLSQAVEELSGQVVRSSSLVENLNSRLRNYFYLRRQLGPDYLALLQFYLNHRRFPRSEHQHRVGKSPAELLTGESHRHWLELLGYQRFSRS